jgi:VanZ family protein
VKIVSRIWRYGPLVLWLILIFFASTGEFSAMNTSRIVRPLLLWLFPDISEARLQLVHLLMRKAAHFTEYAVLGWLAARAFATSSRDLLRRNWFWAGLVLIILQAAMDEYHQSFVASRTGSPYDSFIDIAGGLFALILFAYVRARRNRLRPVTSY